MDGGQLIGHGCEGFGGSFQSFGRLGKALWDESEELLREEESSLDFLAFFFFSFSLALQASSPWM